MVHDAASASYAALALQVATLKKLYDKKVIDDKDYNEILTETIKSLSSSEGAQALIKSIAKI